MTAINVGAHNGKTDEFLKSLTDRGEAEIVIPPGVSLLDHLGIDKDTRERQRVRNYITNLEKNGSLALTRETTPDRTGIRIAAIRIVKAGDPLKKAVAKATKVMHKEKDVPSFEVAFEPLTLDQIPLLKEYMVKKLKAEEAVQTLRDLGAEVVYEFPNNTLAEEGMRVWQYCMSLIEKTKDALAEATMTLQSVALQRDNIQIERDEAVTKLGDWYKKSPMGMDEPKKNGSPKPKTGPNPPNQNEREQVEAANSSKEAIQAFVDAH